MSEDYYAVLGVDEDASQEEILAAYRSRVTDHHPDVTDKDDAQETIRRLNRAKAVLTDDARRREYDRVGHDRFERRDHDATKDDADTSPPSDQRTRDQRDTLTGHRGVVDGRPAFDRLVRRSPQGIDIDLESCLYRSFGRGSGSPRGCASTDSYFDREPEPVTCPRCGGRGSFVHVIDTSRGERRRVEPCERCDGRGTVAG